MAETVEWVCPGCEQTEVVEKKGHHKCSSCRVYGFDFDIAPYPFVPPAPVVQGPDDVSSQFPLPVSPCQGCSDEEWGEYAARFPELAEADLAERDVTPPGPLA